MTDKQPLGAFAHRDLLGIEGLSVSDITHLLDAADAYVDHNRQVDKKTSALRGRTQINLFFESSTRKARLSWQASAWVPMS
jgi:aspartate carbamoyltransferase catalytic subunit